jgi:hypothetical protein
MNTVPQELDWVDKRAACTVEAVFNQLCDKIVEDVEAINAAHKLPDLDSFLASPHSDGTTMFVGQPNRTPRKRLAIGIVGKRFQVKQEWDGKTWEASIGLNNEGRCILRLDDGTELEQWQFRKKALEGLFFGD